MELDRADEWPEVVASFPGADPVPGRSARAPRLAMARRSARGRRSVLAVGPEGGFTAAEAELAVGNGWFPIRLGYTILRVETAGLAGCAALLARVAEEDE